MVLKDSADYDFFQKVIIETNDNKYIIDQSNNSYSLLINNSFILSNSLFLYRWFNIYTKAIL